MFEAMVWPRVEVSARHLFQRSVEEMCSGPESRAEQ